MEHVVKVSFLNWRGFCCCRCLSIFTWIIMYSFILLRDAAVCVRFLAAVVVAGIEWYRYRINHFFYDQFCMYPMWIKLARMYACVRRMITHFSNIILLFSCLEKPEKRFDQMQIQMSDNAHAHKHTLYTMLTEIGRSKLLVMVQITNSKNVHTNAKYTNIRRTVHRSLFGKSMYASGIRRVRKTCALGKR